jgi:xanthine dehydrogenase accessory factor
VSHEIDRILESIRRIIDDGGRGVLVTLLRTSGSTYRRAGARAVLAENGTACGLVSGGCIEHDLALRMNEWLSAGPQIVTYDSTTDTDLIFGSGLGCRGTLELLIEPFDAAHPPAILAHFRWNGREPVVLTTRLGDREMLVECIRPPRALAVFGNGADVEPLIRLAAQLHWTTVHFAAAERGIDGSAFDAAVVMTHNFLHDAELLDLLLPSPVPYVGVLGPKQRGKELLEHLSKQARARADRLRSPIGLDLGGDTPEEIALSILTEIQAVLNGRDACSLQSRHAPIHQPEQVCL